MLRHRVGTIKKNTDISGILMLVCNLCQECLLCPTGFSANMAVLTAVTSEVPGKRGSTESPVAIFSDALNHASIVDGVRVAQRQSNAEVHVYRHNDMMHLQQLL